ncbi:MAG TPA: alpha/beta hydrolase [Actinophytocola sp.]|nr:alpha/beta hydrolase [Actinophytocola sp.]
MSRSVTSRDGTRIAFDQVGTGPAVILVAGAFQFRAFDQPTVELAGLLAEQGFTVVNYDRRGRGESGPTGPGSLDREIEDVAALVEQVGGAAALYGSSSGAAIALWAATKNIGVRALALWEPPFSLDDDGVAFADELQRLVDAGRHERAVEYFMKDMPPEWLEGSKAGPAWPVMVDIAPSLTGDAAALARSQGGGSWATRWASVEVPTLVLTGAQTLPIFPPAAEALAQALPDARRETISASGHGWEPAVMAAALTSFLRTV